MNSEYQTPHPDPQVEEKRSNAYLSRNMRFSTMWYVRPAKAQISLHICAD